MNINARNKGFTLIELLVVISIIGLLGSIIVASTRTGRARARDAKRISAMRQVKLGLDLFENEADGYPQVSDWNRAARSNTMLGCGTQQFFSVPLDPTSGDPYTYETGQDRTPAKCGNGQVYLDFKIEFVTEQSSSLGPAGTYYQTPSGFTSTPPF